MKTSVAAYAQISANNAPMSAMLISSRMGDYERKVESNQEFPNSDFIVNGMDIGSITIRVAYCLHVFHPPIVSRFDVGTRGRLWSYAPVVLPGGGTAQMNIVEGPDSLR